MRKNPETIKMNEADVCVQMWNELCWLKGKNQGLSNHVQASLLELL